MVTQVPSVPTRARATLKPFSGQKFVEVVAGDAARDCRESVAFTRVEYVVAQALQAGVDLAYDVRPPAMIA